MSASFDEELIRKAGKVVGTEVRGLYSREHEGILSVWAPTIDMERDPRWGRTEEAYGEDPLLTGKWQEPMSRGCRERMINICLRRQP